MHTVSGDVPVSRSVLPPGERGVDVTVKKMVQLAHSNWGSKSPRIRALAMNIVNRAGIPSKDYYGEVVAIHNWVRDNIRYFRDPVGQETLADPEQTAFNLKGGDCDDMTTLEIALLGAVGIKSYPVVVGQSKNNFSHVYLHAEVPAGSQRNAGKIIPLDPIMKQWPAGKEANPKVFKAKKTYEHFSNPLVLGAPMSGIGDYVVSPSYLDQENSHAAELLVPDKHASYTYKDKTVAVGVRASTPMEGIDGLMGPVKLAPTGDYFNAQSAGDQGTIVKQDGQLIPSGFIRDEPNAREIMSMHPATARETGPLGPIFQDKFSEHTARIPKGRAQAVPSIQRQMATGLPAQAIPTPVGGKQYELPAVARELRRENLTGKGYNTYFLKKQKTVTLKSLPKRKLGQQAQPRTLGEALAMGEIMLAGLGQEMAAKQAQVNKAPLAQREKIKNDLAAIHRRIITVEKAILELRQAARVAKPGFSPASRVRAAAVSAGQNIPRPQSENINSPALEGMSEITSALKNPWVYVPAIGVLALFAARKFLFRRKTA